jgi:hypothetical protein
VFLAGYTERPIRLVEVFDQANWAQGLLVPVAVVLVLAGDDSVAVLVVNLLAGVVALAGAGEGGALLPAGALVVEGALAAVVRAVRLGGLDAAGADVGEALPGAGGVVQRVVDGALGGAVPDELPLGLGAGPGAGGDGADAGPDDLGVLLVEEVALRVAAHVDVPVGEGDFVPGGHVGDLLLDRLALGVADDEVLVDGLPGGEVLVPLVGGEVLGVVVDLDPVRLVLVGAGHGCLLSQQVTICSSSSG